MGDSACFHDERYSSWVENGVAHGQLDMGGGEEIGYVFSAELCYVWDGFAEVESYTNTNALRLLAYLVAHPHLDLKCCAQGEPCAKITSLSKV